SGSNERLPIIHISGSRTGKIIFKNSGILYATKQVVIENEVNKELKGKLNEYPSEHKNSEENDNKDADNSNQSENTNEEQIQSAGEPIRSGQLKKEPVDLEGLKVYKERLVREINKNANIYEEYRREVLLIIDKLENDLREIFVVRRTNKWKSGFKIGKKIDIKKRIQEKAKGVLVIESRAWQKRELPKEKDYAISILVDLSGSMRKNNKSIEAFKAIIILAEVLNRLGIKVEILGFNDELYEYQKFGEEISKQSREHMGGMLKEVEDSCCNACGNEHNETDLGWATKIASERLSRQTEENKFLITITDGKLESSSEHPKADYDLNEIIKDIVSEQKSRLIGLGIGQGTEQVSEYYPNSVANILASEMGKKLADIIREVIENYDQFFKTG
ncbi:MAG: VWA domain-containing protein, partial [Candidatus Falkowbacteria bacterium]|nr:VWA domain-containing protein [Candidatus Falkowbacteria bacterium]